AVLAREELPVVGHGQTDSVGDLEPGFLSHRVDGVDEIVDPPLQLQLGVDLRVESDRELAVLGHRPSLDRNSLPANDVLGPELLTVDANASVTQLLEVAPLERLLQLADLRPETRPKTRKVRQEPDAGDRTLVENDPAHAKPLRDPVGLAASRPRSGAG